MNASSEYPQSIASSVAGRRNLWVAVAIGAVMVAVVVLLAVRLTQALGVKNIANKVPIPTVSVTEVGVSSLPTTISVIGTIAARYDMPIGVEGDAGRVAAIYVEAGDRVKRGQVLARLNVSVLEPQVANLEAALEQARAEAELADAEYRRAQAVGASGALSAEENAASQVRRIDRRGQGESRRRPAGRSTGSPCTRGGARAGGWDHIDAQRRSGANRDAGRRGAVSSIGRR